MSVAVGYIRVSKEEQAREGISIAVQKKKIKAYCELHGLILVGIYGDPGVPGKKVSNRLGLLSVLELVNRRAVQHVVIMKLDRLARKTTDTLRIAEKMDRKGVSLHSILDHVDTKSAIGRFFFTMQAAIAQFESEQTGERIKTCLGELKKTGARYTKDAPYGYKHVQDGTKVRKINGVDTIVPSFKRVEDKKEQKCMGLLREMHESHPGWSLRRLGRELVARGCTNRDGRPWHPQSIKEMLERIEEKEMAV